MFLLYFAFLFFFNLISFFYLSRVVTEKPHKGSVNKLLCCIVLWHREISAFFSGYASVPFETAAKSPVVFPMCLQDLQGYDFKSDIYSVGITAIQLGRGTVPYVGMPPTKVTRLVYGHLAAKKSTRHQRITLK